MLYRVCVTCIQLAGEVGVIKAILPDGTAEMQLERISVTLDTSFLEKVGKPRVYIQCIHYIYILHFQPYCLFHYSVDIKIILWLSDTEIFKI